MYFPWTGFCLTVWAISVTIAMITPPNGDNDNGKKQLTKLIVSWSLVVAVWFALFSPDSNLITKALAATLPKCQSFLIKHL